MYRRKDDRKPISPGNFVEYQPEGANSLANPRCQEVSEVIKREDGRDDKLMLFIDMDKMGKPTRTGIISAASVIRVWELRL